MDRATVVAALMRRMPHRRDFLEAALPLFAGAAYGWTRHGSSAHSEPASLVILGLIIAFTLLVFAMVARQIRGTVTAAVLLGSMPALLGCLIVNPVVPTLRDPILASLVIPFAMWAAIVRTVRQPSAHSRSWFLLGNTAAVAALLVPVIAGQIHWGIIVLPFAVFRIAAGNADKISAGSESGDQFAEARALADRIQWIGGAWVAGWAGVMP